MGPDPRYLDPTKLIPKLAVLAVVEVDRMEKWRVECDEVVIRVVEAKDDPRLRVAVHADRDLGIHEVLTVDDRCRVFRRGKVAARPFGFGTVVLPCKTLGGTEIVA